MDGSSIDFVVIPIVVLPLLAMWLIGVSYCAAHPLWRQPQPPSQWVATADSVEAGVNPAPEALGEGAPGLA